MRLGGNLRRLFPGSARDSERTTDQPAPGAAGPLVDQMAGSERQLWTSDDLSLVRADEGTFLLPNRDHGISRTIQLHGSWAADDVTFFRRMIRPGDVVLDVGANIGHHSVVFSKGVGPEGRVLAFEPQLFLFELLSANLVLNGATNVVPLRLAAGEEAGHLRMLPTDYSVEGNYGALPISRLNQNERGERVEVVTLDTAVRSNELASVDFVKIDVQSFELFVLRGARTVLDEFRPAVFVEISPYWMDRLNEVDYTRVYELLAEVGYVVVDRDLEPCPPPQPTSDDPASEEWDIVAVPRERVGQAR